MSWGELGEIGWKVQGGSLCEGSLHVQLGGGTTKNEYGWERLHRQRGVPGAEGRLRVFWGAGTVGEESNWGYGISLWGRYYMNPFRVIVGTKEERVYARLQGKNTLVPPRTVCKLKINESFVSLKSLLTEAHPRQPRGLPIEEQCYMEKGGMTWEETVCRT